jgi:activator of HSP90 ATPase
MSRVIKQSVTLPAPAKKLYAMYLSARTHGAVIGGKVSISAKPNSRFSCFGGMLQGRTLYTVPGKLIVQAWRSRKFRKSDIDSTLILRFTPRGRQGRIDLVHVNVPPQDLRGVSKGWPAHYWKPWRRYLKKKR